MIFIRARIEKHTKTPAISITVKETDSSPLHTTAYVPGTLENGLYEITDIDSLPREARDIINNVWTPEVHEAYQNYLRNG